MSQATLPSHHVPSSVAAKLRGLRMKITAWLLVDGLSRVLGVLIGLILIDLAVDYFFSLDVYQRIVMLVLGGAAVAFVAYYRLLVPLTTPVPDDALILAVEGHYGKELGESLISAVQFSRIGDVDALGVSPQLVKASIDQGTQAADRIKFGTVVDSGWFVANLALLFATGALLAAGGYAVANTEMGSIWWDRNVLLQDRGWPQDTYLDVQYAQDNVLIIPRGDDWPLTVTVKEDSERKPDEVLVDFVSKSGRRTEKMEAVEKQKRFRIDLKNVIEEFQFRARTRKGRGHTVWYKAKLVERPAVDELTLTKTFPDYAGGESEQLPPGTGPYHVLAGSDLEIRGQANKPLSSAVVQVGEESVEMTIADERQFSARIPAGQLADGGYRIDLVDTESIPQPGRREAAPLESKRPTRFTVRIKPDREPDVVAKLVGISGMVVPRAIIPYSCFIKDEFAITDVKLSYQWRHEENAAAGDEGEFAIEPAQETLGERAMRFDDVFDLEPLEIQAGSGLSFHIAATDNNDISGPGMGKSTVFLLRVVTEDELWTDLLRREKEQRQDFERLHKNLEQMLTDCQALQAGTRDAQELSSDERREILKLQKDHKLLSTNIGNVAKRLNSIVIEIGNNRLEEEDATTQKRLTERIILPMEKLAGEDVPFVINRLDETRLHADETEPRNEALAQAIARQQQIAESMRQILRHMVEAEGYQEAVQLLYEIQKSQQDVRELTLKEKQKLIEEILQGKKPDEGSSDSDSEDGDQEEEEEEEEQ